MNLVNNPGSSALVLDVAEVSSWSWCLGALIGYMLSVINPPLYQGSALIQVSIDQNRASVPNDITIRQAYDRVRLIILADDTLITALDRYSESLEERGTLPTLEEFRSKIKLAQRFNAFELVVNSADPVQAAFAG